MAEKSDSALVSYVLGIVSIVMAFFQPLAGIILGIIGIKQSSRGDGDLAKRGRKLSKIGIWIGVIIFVLILAFTTYVAYTCKVNPSAPICRFTTG